MRPSGRWQSNDQRSTALIALVFFTFAVPTSVYGVLWPAVRERFDKSLGALGTVGLLYGIGRFATAGMGNTIRRQIGLARGLTASLVVLAAACLSAATAPSWWLFLIAMLTVGACCGALDSLGALFITGSGDIRRAGLVHGAYGVGATIAPLLGARIASWRVTLFVAAVWSLLVAVTLFRSRLVSSHDAEPVAKHASSPLPLRVVTLALSLFAVCVGLEVTIGTWAFSFLTEHRNFAATFGSLGVGGFWFGITVGRLMMSTPRFATFIHDTPLYRFSLVGVLFLVAIAVIPQRPVVALFFVLGVVLAPVVSTLLARTALRVGEFHAARISGYQLMAANVGAIAVPALTGLIVDRTNAGAIMIVIIALSVGAVGLLAFDAVETSSGV